MARMRTIKPEFWVDDKIVDLDLLPKLLFIGLWNFADDEGYIEASPRRIKRQIFPDSDYDVAAALDALVSAGLLRVYLSDQGDVFHITNFANHQKPQHPTPTKYTSIHETNSTAHAVSDTHPEVARTPHEGSSLKGGEGSGEERKRSAARRGTRIHSDFSITEDMRGWARENTPLVDIEKKLPEFIDYWSGVAGEKGVKLDWLSTWRNGMRKQQEFAERDRVHAGVPATPKKVFTAHAD